jgi:hypothetical protein
MAPYKGFKLTLRPSCKFPPSEVGSVRATDTWPALDKKKNLRKNLTISEMISRRWVAEHVCME